MNKVIYKIINISNNKFYVGSTTNKHDRFQQHRRRLRKGTHHSYLLQKAWDKYGEDFFKFEVIETIPESESLEAAEDKWLKKHHGEKHCYNVGTSCKAPWRGTKGTNNAPNIGRVVSDETKEKISISVKKKYEDPEYNPRKGRHHSDESKLLISKKVKKATSEGRGGCFIPSDETRKKMSESLMGNTCAKGWKRTDEEKEQIRQKMLGNQNFKGKHHTEETKAKMGISVVEVSTGKEFNSLSDAANYFCMTYPTAHRSLTGGKPISSGKNAGLQFIHAGDSVEPVPDEFKEYPTTRQKAKDTGAKFYFTGQPCKRGHIARRLVKGACEVCRKEDWKKVTTTEGINSN